MVAAVEIGLYTSCRMRPRGLPLGKTAVQECESGARRDISLHVVSRGCVCTTVARTGCSQHSPGLVEMHSVG